MKIAIRSIDFSILSERLFFILNANLGRKLNSLIFKCSQHNGPLMQINFIKTFIFIHCFVFFLTSCWLNLAGILLQASVHSLLTIRDVLLNVSFMNRYFPTSYRQYFLWIRPDHQDRRDDRQSRELFPSRILEYNKWTSITNGLNSNSEYLLGDGAERV